MGLQEEIAKVEASKLRDAIVAQSGNLALVAKTLGMAKSTLTSKLIRNHEGLLDLARTIRDKRGEGRGRPRKREHERTRKAVTKSWISSEYVYSVAARSLKIPASSCRELVQRYDLEKLKPKKPKAKKKRTVKKTNRVSKRARRKTRAS